MACTPTWRSVGSPVIATAAHPGYASTNLQFHSESFAAFAAHIGDSSLRGRELWVAMTSRPDLLLPAYYQGRNLAESYYLAIPRLSWQNIVVGDPLCALGKP